jgi:3-phenylpropionate/trans-cinnamate dioxygenase ferredoxin reductase subunit
VVTDDRLRTSVPSIYAAGDVAVFYDAYTGMYSQVGTWDNAASQGRHVARAMAGGDEPYVEVPTYTTTMFHSRLRVVGATPETNPEVEAISAADGAARTYTRLFFLRDQLVGAVAIGEMRNRKELLSLIKTRQRVRSAERATLLQAC